MDRYDLIIIGGGAGAFAAAIRANELGAKTAMVNAGLPLGGTCVNVGCVPSKTLLWAGEILHTSKHHGIPGVELEIKQFDFQKVVADELALVERLRKEKYEKVLKDLGHLTYVKGEAQFTSPHEIIVRGKTMTAKKFIIAAGSTANVPAIDGIREVGYVTHIEALKLKKQPKELVVIGAGLVALEFAQMYARFGTTVTILHRNDKIFRAGERQVVARLVEVLKKEGITITTDVTFHNARKSNGKKVLSYSVEGKKSEIFVDEILLASGKTANTKELNLKKADVGVDKRQAVVVNEFFQTKQQHIFSVGDIAALPLRLETTAGREGTLAAENAISGTQNSIDYKTVPYTIFTDPQLAGVGLTEDQQMQEMGVCACRSVSFEHVPKAMIMRRTEGLIKMAIHPETRVIQGVHILAPYAGELIAEAMMLVKNKNTIDDVVSSLPMFPTLSEAIKIVALSFTKDISKLSCCI
ncbi:mercury(II) reductase [Patescibacteria group bacterium]|nr:mercury(II) reductase [Patescibacteria group bacterium]